MCQIKRINERNPYPHWIKKFSRDWEYLQQMELNSASSYPRSESTAVVNYFHQLKYMNVFGTHKKFRIWKGPNMT